MIGAIIFLMSLMKPSPKVSAPSLIQESVRQSQPQLREHLNMEDAIPKGSVHGGGLGMIQA